MYTSPSAIFLNQTSGYTKISVCYNLNFSHLNNTPIEQIQRIMSSCHATHLDQIMQMHEGYSLYVIQREGMFSIIDHDNKMITCMSKLPSIYDSQAFNDTSFVSSMRGIYQEVCISINKPNLRSKRYCEKETNNHYNYNYIDGVWKENCPTSYKILPISPYNRMAGMYISIYQDNSNEYKMHLGHLYNSTTLLTAPVPLLRETFQNNSTHQITDIESLKPLAVTNKLPHIIFSEHIYDSCQSGIYILTPTAERQLYFYDNSKATDSSFDYDSYTINKRTDFLDNLYPKIFDTETPNNRDGCVLTKSAYQIDKLIENYFDDMTDLPRAKRQTSLETSNNVDSNYNPYNADQNLLSTNNSQSNTTESYDVETTQRSNFFTNISDKFMNTLNDYYPAILGGLIGGAITGGTLGWSLAYYKAKNLALSQIIVGTAIASTKGADASISDSPSSHDKKHCNDDNLDNIDCIGNINPVVDCI